MNEVECIYCCLATSVLTPVNRTWLHYFGTESNQAAMEIQKDLDISMVTDAPTGPDLVDFPLCFGKLP